MKRRYTITAAALAVVATLAGCQDAQPEVPTTPTVTERSTADEPIVEPTTLAPTEPTYTAQDEEYIALLDKYVPNWEEYGGKEATVNNAEIMCGLIKYEGGNPYEVIVDEDGDFPIPAEDWAYVLSAGVRVYCPEYERSFDRWWVGMDIGHYGIFGLEE